MDVELLSKMVGELIAGHDQVGLPGVGTFVAEVVPATFSDKGYTVNPPYRRLSFHSSRLEDKLLIDFYAESNGVDRDSAKAYLIQFLSDLKAVLKDRKTIIFPGLGRLRATRENNFFFVPDEDLDIFPEGFGLKPVSLKTHSSSLSDERSVDNLQVVQPLVIATAEVAEPMAETTEATAEVAVTTVADAVVEAAQIGAAVGVQSQEECSDWEEHGDLQETKPDQKAPVVSAIQEEQEQQVQNEQQQNEQVQEQEVGKGRSGRWAVVLAIVLVSLAVVALLAFLVLAEVAPDFIDSILYTSEELRIINY